MARILIVEDHPDTAIVLTTELGVGGHDVESAGDGSDALDRLARRSYDLVILDLVLPKLSGEAVLRRIRERHDSTLVLILSGKDTLADRVAGLGLGADDYLTKPFEMAELLARVETLLRRAGRPPAEADAAESTIWRFGQIEVDQQRRKVFRHGREVKLTRKEYDLLICLIERKGRDVSKQELLATVWGYPASADTRTLDTHIHRLRKLLEDDPHHPRHLVTVHRFGYRFEP
jgi:two-component system response regulator RegX3